MESRTRETRGPIEWGICSREARIREIRGLGKCAIYSRQCEGLAVAPIDCWVRNPLCAQPLLDVEQRTKVHARASPGLQVRNEPTMRGGCVAVGHVGRMTKPCPTLPDRAALAGRARGRLASAAQGAAANSACAPYIPCAGGVPRETHETAAIGVVDARPPIRTDATVAPIKRCACGVALRAIAARRRRWRCGRRRRRPARCELGGHVAQRVRAQHLLHHCWYPQPTKVARAMWATLDLRGPSGINNGASSSRSLLVGSPGGLIAPSGEAGRGDGANGAASRLATEAAPFEVLKVLGTRRIPAIGENTSQGKYRCETGRGGFTHETVSKSNSTFLDHILSRLGQRQTQAEPSSSMSEPSPRSTSSSHDIPDSLHSSSTMSLGPEAATPRRAPSAHVLCVARRRLPGSFFSYSKMSRMSAFPGGAPAPSATLPVANKGRVLKSINHYRSMPMVHSV